MEVVGRKMYRMTLSLKPANRENPANPNTHAALAIESIAIHESEFIGRASPTVIAFNPWMNAIIGGRGIGKSTTVDMCRNTLRREGDLDVHKRSETRSLRDLFERRMSVLASRQAEGLANPASLTTRQSTKHRLRT